MRIVQPSAAAGTNGAEMTGRKLEGVRPGDSFEAEVVSSDENGVRLRLADGTEVTAQRSSSGELPQGQVLTFTVTSRSGGQLTVALTDPSVAGQNVDIPKLVNAFGAPRTAQNIALLSEMLAGGLTPAKDTFQALSAQLARYPELTPQQAVFMTREGIPVTPENIAQFQAFLEHENLVGDQLQNILQILDDVLPAGDAAAASGGGAFAPPEAADAMSHGVTATPGGAVFAAPAEGAVLPQGEAPVVPPRDFGVSAPRPEAGTAVGNMMETLETAAARTAAPAMPAMPSLSEPAAQTQAQVLTPALAETPEQPVPAGQARQAGQAGQEARVTGGAEQEPSAARGGQPAPSQELPAAGGRAAPEPVAADARNVGQRAAAAYRIQETPERAEQAIRTDRAAVTKQAEQTGQTARASGPAGSDAARFDAQTDVRKLVASLFRKVDISRAGRLPEEMNARALARELDEAITLLRQKAEQLPEGARARLTSAAGELERSAQFLNRLSGFTPVVGVPLEWGGDRTTAELYVFNDGRGGKRVDPQNATVFLSLMTSNAGRVETLIKVLGKNVECDFKLEPGEAAELTRAGMPDLSELLEEQGFHLARTSVRESWQAADLFDADRARAENMPRYFFNRTV